MVFFLTNMWPEDFSRGITKKSFSQIEAMNNIGCKVDYYTGYVADSVCVFDENGNVVESNTIPFQNDMFKRIFRNYYLKRLVKDFFSEKKCDSSVLYSRYFYFDALTRKLFKNAHKNNMKVILELHSFPCYFWKSLISYPIYFLDFLYRKSNLAYIDCIAAMTDVKIIWNKKTINFENGININGVVPHKRSREKDLIRIIAVSYEWEVHGYDRLLKGLSEYYSNEQKYRVEVIFVGTLLKSTKKLIKKLNLEEYVMLPGVISGKELDELYNKSDLGMGCMALHRRSKCAVSDLKTKEYIAKGIPYIFAGNQMGQDELFKYSYRFNDDDSPLDINKIVSFYESLLDEENLVETIRTYGGKYSWDYQMNRIFEAFEV